MNTRFEEIGRVVHEAISAAEAVAPTRAERMTSEGGEWRGRAKHALELAREANDWLQRARQGTGEAADAWARRAERVAAKALDEVTVVKEKKRSSSSRPESSR